MWEVSSGTGLKSEKLIVASPAYKIVFSAIKMLSYKEWEAEEEMRPNHWVLLLEYLKISGKEWQPVERLKNKLDLKRKKEKGGRGI